MLKKFGLMVVACSLLLSQSPVYMHAFFGENPDKEFQKDVAQLITLVVGSVIVAGIGLAAAIANEKKHKQTDQKKCRNRRYPFLPRK